LKSFSNARHDQQHDQLEHAADDDIRQRPEQTHLQGREDRRYLRAASKTAPEPPDRICAPDTLDAIHLTTAQQLETELSRLITYDERLGAAAQAIGCSVIAPS
jgi:hypothetical protein